MVIIDIISFRTRLEEIGYKRETRDIVLGYASEMWCKHIKPVHGAHYELAVRIFDWHKKATGADMPDRWTACWRLTIYEPHEVSGDRLELNLNDRTLTPETFEQRAARYFAALCIVNGKKGKVRSDAGADLLLPLLLWRDQQVKNRPTPACPACGECRQVQLLTAIMVPAEYRCRTCKHPFTYEP